ncbi:MAG: YkvA family protein [Cyanobacteria bacterium P01_G01_bin.39]
MMDTTIEDRQSIAESFPSNRQEMEFNGVTGWLYTLTNESSDEFKMFVYNDGNRYQVVVVFPENAIQYSLENIYISDDGRIVNNSENGFSSLEEALKISVHWAMFSAKEETDILPSEQTSLSVQEKPSLDRMTPPDYDREDFWRKLNENALKAGKDVIEKALTLYYATQSENVPAWAKTLIFSSLAYFVLPTDMIPDVMPFVGYTDDLSVLLSTFLAVEMYVTLEHKEAAEKKLQQWFGGNKA